MKIVVALGGNALLRRDELPTAEAQQHHVNEAVGAISRLAARHSLVITHGTARKWACWRCRRRPTAASRPTRSTSSAPRARG